MKITSSKEAALYLVPRRSKKIYAAAQAAGISKETISNWRSRRRSATLEHIIKLADFLGYELHIVRKKV